MPEFFTFTTAEPAFPAGMYFRVNASIAPDIDITSLTLLVQPEDRPAQTFNIPRTDADVFIRDGRVLTVNFIWQFEDAAEAPDLFTDVMYTWTLVTADGRQDAIANTARYLDERAQWTNAPNADLNMDLWYVRGNFSDARFYDLIGPAYERMQSRTQPIDPVTLVIYDSDTPLACSEENEEGESVAVTLRAGVEVPCRDEIAAELFATTERVIVDERGFSRRVARIMDVLVTQFYGERWEAANVPAWFRVGATRLYDPTDDVALHAEVAFRAVGQGLLTLDEMQTAPSVDDDLYSLFEAQGYGLVIYIAERFGVEAVDELAETAGDYASFDEAFERITGQALAAFYNEWQVWVLRDDVLDTFALNLYAGATPTPTTIPTATQTFTPLPTLTPTLTPTITLTPTNSPTATRVPPTATFTPLAVQDFFTPTPTATPIPALIVADADPVDVRNVMLGVIGLAAILLIVGIAVNRNRF
ncbi:MAG: hypothetical protein AAF787_14420 [Chloroflexota bacterium]